jgi:hypothetical protein
MLNRRNTEKKQEMAVWIKFEITNSKIGFVSKIEKRSIFDESIGIHIYTRFDNNTKCDHGGLSSGLLKIYKN